MEYSRQTCIDLQNKFIWNRYKSSFTRRIQASFKIQRKLWIQKELSETKPTPHTENEGWNLTDTSPLTSNQYKYYVILASSNVQDCFCII